MSEKASQVFRTHSNYVSAIRYLASNGILDNMDDALNLLASRVYDSGCLNFEYSKQINSDELHHSINNAWGIEALFKTENTIIKEDDLIRLSNNWCIVQVYYILYYATQALSITYGFDRPVTHPQTQRTYFRIWSSMNHILVPWSVTYDENGYNNLPSDQVIDDQIHSWTKVDEGTALSIYCKALRTTRDEYIDEALTKRRDRLSARKNQNTVKLTDEDKVKTVSRIRPTSLINYLFRLKRRTSYEQASAFAIGPQNKFQSKDFRDNLSFIIRSTLLVTEFIISKAVGEDNYIDWFRKLNEDKTNDLKNTGPQSRFEIIF